MKWDIQYSRYADEFITKQKIRVEVREQLGCIGIFFFKRRSRVV
jgi:hypothetical protein